MRIWSLDGTFQFEELDGVEVVIMLTGDYQATAQRIADELGVDTVISEVLPEDKSTKVAELQTPPGPWGSG